MFINVNLGSEVQEPQAVPENRYLLRVVNVQTKESKNTGAPMVEAMHEIDGQPDAQPIFHYLVLPTEEDEPKTVKFKLLNIKRYLHMAGIPFDESGFNHEDLMGAEFEANVTFDTGEDSGRGPSNSIKLDRLPHETE